MMRPAARRLGSNAKTSSDLSAEAYGNVVSPSCAPTSIQVRRYDPDMARRPNASRSARRWTLRTKLAASEKRSDVSADLPPLTIFSAPKAFQGHVGIIQENAVRSWLSLSPQPQIILFSTEADLGDDMRRLDVEVITSVETNTHGTPLVSSMFSQADKLAAGDVAAFISSDIILTQATVDAARIAREWSPRFLLVAQRHDVDVRNRIAFEDGWEARWVQKALSEGTLHSPGAIDLFLYARGQYAEMPPFAIGP